MSMQLRGLEPSLRANAEVALLIADRYGLKPVITSVVRNMSEQAKLRANFNDCVTRGLFPSAASLAPGMSCKYPANQPGDSAHNYGLAWDSWVPDEQMDLWKRIREYCGFRVPDNDLVHAELADWRNYIG
jgi:hypothetical protein